jgi:hypothetical protein
MKGYTIVRKNDTEYEPYKKEADKIFRKIYGILKWVPFRLRLSKEISIIIAMEIQNNLVNRNWVVLVNSNDKKNIVETFWDGVIESLDQITKIKK